MRNCAEPNVSSFIADSDGECRGFRSPASWRIPRKGKRHGQPTHITERCLHFMRRLHYPEIERFSELQAQMVTVTISALSLLAAAAVAFNGSDKSTVAALVIAGVTLSGGVCTAVLELFTPGLGRLLPSFLTLATSVGAAFLLWDFARGASQTLLAVPPLLLVGPFVRDAVLAVRQRSLLRLDISRALKRHGRSLDEATALTLARGMTNNEIAALCERLQIRIPASIQAIYKWRDGQRPGTSPNGWAQGRFPGLREGLAIGARERHSYCARTGEILSDETWIVLADANPFFVVIRLSVKRLEVPGVVHLNSVATLSHSITENLDEFVLRG